MKKITVVVIVLNLVLLAGLWILCRDREQREQPQSLYGNLLDSPAETDLPPDQVCLERHIAIEMNSNGMIHVRGEAQSQAELKEIIRHGYKLHGQDIPVTLYSDKDTSLERIQPIVNVITGEGGYRMSLGAKYKWANEPTDPHWFVVTVDHEIIDAKHTVTLAKSELWFDGEPTTMGNIRKRLEKLPDDVWVLVRCDDHTRYQTLIDVLSACHVAEHQRIALEIQTSGN